MENKNDVLSVFEGLSRDEVERLRLEIIPILQELRRKITGEKKSVPVRAGAQESVTEILDAMTANLNTLAFRKKKIGTREGSPCGA